MNDLSIKSKIVYATMEMLEATSKQNEVTSYTILDFIEENEELQDHPLLKELNEEEVVEAILEMNIKAINTIISSLARKDIVEKSETSTVRINGKNRSLKKYFIKNYQK